MPPRSRLSRDKILRAALAIVDEVGLDGLTVRGLTARLGVTPMAIYRHFESKGEILDCLLEVVIADAAPTAHSTSQPRAWLVESFTRMYDALREHSAVIPLLGTSASWGFAAFEQVEAVFTVLEGAGLRPEEATRTFHALIAYTVGAAALQNAAKTQADRLGKDPAAWKAAVRSRMDKAAEARLPRVLRAAPHFASFASRKQFIAGLEAMVASTPLR